MIWERVVGERRGVRFSSQRVLNVQRKQVLLFVGRLIVTEWSGMANLIAMCNGPRSLESAQLEEWS